MNHRRALHISTNLGLLIFALTIIGVVLWTADEGLGWDLLPPWIDTYARLLVMVMGILAGFSVVISAMCSLAVIAESAAEKAGLAAPPPPRLLKRILLFGAPATLAVMFSLHSLDQYRAARRADAMKAAFRERLPDIEALFTPERADALRCQSSTTTDQALGQLMLAIRESTAHKPDLMLLVPAEAPYTHCVITAHHHPYRRGPGQPDEHLGRRFLTGFPTAWEAEAVRAGFAGQRVEVPDGQAGVFLDTTMPVQWAPLPGRDGVAALLLVHGFLPR